MLEHMQACACIFCGAQNPANYKNLSHEFVWNILQKQQAAGIDEQVFDFLRNYVAAEMHNAQRAKDESEEDAISGNVAEDELCAYASVQLHSCMCCYYWVARRQKQKIVPLPMQNFMWYVRTLKGCDSKRCDSRILLRLLKTVTESGNTYARFFDTSELEGMAAIKMLSESSTTAANVQGDDVFCVKKQLAALWHAHNGESMLLGHAHAADLLR